MKLISLVKCQKVTSYGCLEKCINLAAKVFSETSNIDIQELRNEYREWFEFKDNIFIIAKLPSEEIIGFLRIIPKEISFSIGLINTAKFENIFVVPRNNIRNESVWVVDSQMELMNRSVSIIRYESEYAIINEGIEKGDRLLQSRLSSLINGQKVTFSLN